MALPEINDRGEVSLEGHLIGSIEGFRFTLARSEGDSDAKGLRAAAAQVIAPEIRNRAERLAGAPNEEFILSTDGFVRWKGEIVANLAEGDSLLAPRLIILADESLAGVELERVQERLNLWLRHAVNTQLEPIIALAEPADLEGAARGLAFRLSENLGILPRAAVAEEVKGLDQDVRAKLRKHGIKFGAYHIYLPLGLKPAPRELAIILYALKHGGVRQPGVSELPHIVLSGRTSFLVDPAVDTRLYEVAGFKVAGKRAVRVDILERLADIIRPLIAFDPAKSSTPPPVGAAEGNGFRVTVEMTSLLGCSGEDFASILQSLGYRMRRVPKPAPAAPPPAASPGASEEPAMATQLPVATGEPSIAAPTVDSAPVEGTAAAQIETTGAETDLASMASLEGISVDEAAVPADSSDGAVTPASEAPANVAAQPPAAEAPASPPADDSDQAATVAVEGTSAPAVELASATAAADLGSGPLPPATDTGGAIVEARSAAAEFSTVQAPALPVDRPTAAASAVEAIADSTALSADAAAPTTDATAPPPAEPQFDEIWSPGGRRPEHRHEHRRDNQRPDGQRSEGSRTDSRPPRPPRTPAATPDGSPTPGDPDAASPERPRHHHRRPLPEGGNRPERQHEQRGPRPDRQNGPPRPDRGSEFAAERPRDNRGPRQDKKPAEQTRSFGPKPAGGRPAREAAYDPDSPFAALAVLRDRKPE